MKRAVNGSGPLTWHQLLSIYQRSSHMASLSNPTRALFLAYSRPTHLYLITSEALASTDDLGKFSAAENVRPGRAKTAAPFFIFLHALDALQMRL
jgi:hypothetical protein